MKIDQERLKKMRECAPLLPTPGAEVAIQLLDEIDALHVALAKATRRAERQAQFHSLRWEALQEAQQCMRDPERKMVCDILANGRTDEKGAVGTMGKDLSRAR